MADVRVLMALDCGSRGSIGRFAPVAAEEIVVEEAVAPPEEQVDEREEQEERVIHIPRYHVVLLDDDDHTYEYVIEMLGKLFGHSLARAFRMAVEVDSAGRVVVDTTTKERAELKRDQIHAYGPDWRIAHCKGSMSALVEPAPEA